MAGLSRFLLAGLCIFSLVSTSHAEEILIRSCSQALSELRRVTGFNLNHVPSTFRDPNAPWPSTSRPPACEEIGSPLTDGGLVKLFVELALSRSQYDDYLRRGAFNLSSLLRDNFENFRPGSTHAIESYYAFCDANFLGNFSHCSATRGLGGYSPLVLESYNIIELNPDVIVQMYFQFHVSSPPLQTPTPTHTPTPLATYTPSPSPSITATPTATPTCSGKEDYEKKLGELAMDLASTGCSGAPISSFNEKRSKLRKECKIKEDPSLSLGFARARNLSAEGLNSSGSPFAPQSYLGKACDNTLLIAHFLGGLTVKTRPQGTDTMDSWLKAEGYECSSSKRDNKTGKETMTGPAIHPWKLALFKPVKEPIVIYLSDKEAAKRWPVSSPLIAPQLTQTVVTFVEDHIVSDAERLHQEYLARLEEENKRYQRTGSNRGSKDKISAITWYNTELRKRCGSERNSDCIRFSPFEVALASSQHDLNSPFGEFNPFQRGIMSSYESNEARGLAGGNLETAIVCWKGAEVKEDDECHQFNPEKKCIDEHMRKAGIRKGASGVYVPSSRYDLMAGLYAVSAMEAGFSTKRPIVIKKKKEVILPSPNDTMAAICASESRFTPFLRYLVTRPKKGNSPEDSRGSCQTNLFAHKSKYVSIFGSVSDYPYYTLSNFAVSKAIYVGRSSTFQPWTEFKNGHYKAFLPRVQKRFDEYTAWKTGIDR